MRAMRVDWTVAVDDALTMRYDRCIRCLGHVFWIDLVELDGLPRCVGVCQHCLGMLRQQATGAAGRKVWS